MERNVSRLFAEKIEVFGEVEPSQAGILSSIAKIVLKSLEECIRLGTFNSQGSQVIQISIYHFRKELTAGPIGDDGVVHYLLDGAASAVISRSIVKSVLDADAMKYAIE